MKLTCAASLCVVVLVLGLNGMAQSNDNGSQNDQSPVLKTRPRDDNSNPAPQLPPDATGKPSPYAGPQPYAAAPNAIPEGTRFIIKLKDTLDTRNMQEGKHFKAELREDLVSPSGLIIPKGRTVKAHIG